MPNSEFCYETFVCLIQTDCINLKSSRDTDTKYKITEFFRLKLEFQRNFLKLYSK